MTTLALVDLTVTTEDGRRVVDRLSLTVTPGRVVALVGEPDAGAVAAGLTILDSSPGSTATGELRVGDDELLVLAPLQRRAVRGSRVGALFPDPRTSFDPGLTLVDNLLEVLRHGRAGVADPLAVIAAELAAAGVPEPGVTMYLRAGQLPAGVLQRACVALAAAVSSDLVVAEAPTSSLDTLDGADVRDLLRGLALERNVGVLLITEDLAEAASIADEIVLMYAGEVHEQGAAEDVLKRPRGPYTRALLSSIPRLDVPMRSHRATPGSQPPAGAVVAGCRFADRCPFVEPLCRSQRPDLRTVDGLTVRCHFADEGSWPDRLDAYHRRVS